MAARHYPAMDGKRSQGVPRPARPDPLYTAFVLLILYGLRRGETLGLRWTDIDFEAGTIQIHHLRHAVGSRLKDLHVPARDAQAILGHTRISTTLEIYTNVDEKAQREALTRLHGLLDERQG